MKRILKQSRLWLAPTVLAAAALLACNGVATTETQAGTQPKSESSGQRHEWGDQHRQQVNPLSSAGCPNPRSADDFLPGTRHVPKC
jgi:hypothetical protein